MPDEFDKYYQLWIDEKISLRRAAEELGINYSTFYRRCIEKRGK
ncbi:MAG: hypothetical protein J6J16_10090 [Lachnospiraceae bacterium]|nr:hypothetical protein [Lachnospiraceae bacterium]